MKQQVWSKRRLGNPRGLEIGDAVTRRGEPEVAGVIVQFEPNVYGESEGWAWIETRRGVLRIPTHTLRLRRRSARDTHRFTAAERSGRAHALHRLAKHGGSHTYATPEVKRTASYKRAERLEEQLAPQRWHTKGLTRSEYEKLADAWERAGFLGWADNYRAHVEHHKIGRDPEGRRASKRFLSLHEAANRWNTYLHTVYGPESGRSKFHPRSLSDYYSLSDDDKHALKKILGSTRWRPSAASTAAGRSSLYAFSIALRKERERQTKKGPYAAPRRRMR